MNMFINIFKHKYNEQKANSGQNFIKIAHQGNNTLMAAFAMKKVVPGQFQISIWNKVNSNRFLCHSWPI